MSLPFAPPHGLAFCPKMATHSGRPPPINTARRLRFGRQIVNPCPYLNRYKGSSRQKATRTLDRAKNLRKQPAPVVDQDGHLAWLRIQRFQWAACVQSRNFATRGAVLQPLGPPLSGKVHEGRGKGALHISGNGFFPCAKGAAMTRPAIRLCRNETVGSSRLWHEY